MDKSLKNKLITFFSISIYLSFFLGFYFNENSSGAGNYSGDLTWMWDNFEIYKSNDLWTAIHHPDFWGNRTPLIYILHTVLNPFISDINTYRLSVFCISFSAPLIFYLCLLQKFKEVDKNILFFISSFILLSPYFRTNSYWAGETNYGIITILASIYLLNYTLINNFLRIKTNIYLSLTLLTFFSSLCLYFDQKLLIIPLLVLFKILHSQIDLRYKLYSIVNYCIFSVPFLYLIFIWKGLIPPATQISSPDQGSSLSSIKLHFFHIGYATAIMAFYLLPIILLKTNNLISSLKDFLYDKKNFFFILIFIIYLFFINIFYDFENFTINKQFSTADYGVYGLGILHKISLFLFSDLFYREVFTYLVFFISWIILLFAIEKKTINIIIILYFYFLSLIIFPLMQEYFDPYIILFSILLFNLKFDFKLYKLISAFVYLIIFLTGANLYYFIILS